MALVREGGTVWVTGASGFIGRHLVRGLAARGLRVVGFGRAAADPLPEGLVRLVAGSLSAEALDETIAAQGAPTAVYHFAGGSTVGASIADPLADFDSSVAATARLLDALRRHAVTVPVVLASSAAVYGGGHAGPIGLGADLAPFSPYGHHKLMAEMLGHAYAENYGMRITVLRLFSIYGPEIGKQLIFDLCTRLDAGQNPVKLGGTGHERRDWCHVSDVVRLCTALLPARPGHPDLFNVGSAVGTTIAEAARIVREAWGGGAKIGFSGQSRPGDPFSLVADPASLPPGFAPKVSVEQGLTEFVDWFRKVGPGTSEARRG
jgi:UDP-glucose 4-epimerase